MKIREILKEYVVKTFNKGSYTVQVDSHSLDRARGRGIDPGQVDDLLNKLTSIKPKIKQLETGQRFWMYGVSEDISLGIHIVSKEKRIVRLHTMVAGRTYSDLAPIIDVR